MAEFINQKTGPAPMNFMGKPIPPIARQYAYEHAKEMGLDSARAWEVVGGMSEQLERDKPYEAMAVGMKFLDLTGTYRMMAAILASTAQQDAAT